MDRCGRRCGVSGRRVPHTRGDGPELQAAIDSQVTSVPHTRGDGPPSCALCTRESACSPHAWGWTERQHDLLSYPNRVPHTRGDGPMSYPDMARWQECSPHAWGWTGFEERQWPMKDVFPTRVGMDPEPEPIVIDTPRVPHTRGDGPSDGTYHTRGIGCSPHAWGWTGYQSVRASPGFVFPTRVGMDRQRDRAIRPRAGVPHTRGDGPTLRCAGVPLTACSPHAWGWTVADRKALAQEVVFPTRVGMDRRRSRMRWREGSVPHTRGDGPGVVGCRLPIATCSPHAWGWTAHPELGGQRCDVFPTRVGMDCGESDKRNVSASCSPHAWGWTAAVEPASLFELVFPTRVGMDRAAAAPARTCSACSPHAWGWTVPKSAREVVGHVFPTRVGMDRQPPATRGTSARVPHTRGDGPVGHESPSRASRITQPCGVSVKHRPLALPSSGPSRTHRIPAPLMSLTPASGRVAPPRSPIPAREGRTSPPIATQH